MKQPKGYQLIEPLALAGIYPPAGGYGLAVAFLTWAIGEVRAELGSRIAHVELEIIRIEYIGPYPGIGAHYPTTIEPDVGPLIGDAIERLLRERSLGEFVAFLAARPTDWDELARVLMTPPDA
jgi:hypothetical protein